MMIAKRRVIVRLKHWLAICRQRRRQAHRGPATAPLPTLIAEATAGDQRALQALAAIVVPLVKNYCRVHLGTTEAAEQVAQDVSRTIVKTLPSYLLSRAPFWGYVYGVTTRAVADAQRHPAPEHSYSDHPLNGRPASSSSTPVAPDCWLSYSRPFPPSSGKSSSCEYCSDSASKTPPSSSEPRRPPYGSSNTAHSIGYAKNYKPEGTTRAARRDRLWVQPLPFHALNVVPQGVLKAQITRRRVDLRVARPVAEEVPTTVPDVPRWFGNQNTGPVVGDGGVGMPRFRGRVAAGSTRPACMACARSHRWPERGRLGW
jgi:hypothetical protein